MLETLASPAIARDPMVDRKAWLRAQAVASIRALSDDDRRRRSLEANRRLVDTVRALVPAGLTVALYAPTPTELDCSPAIAALARSHRIAFPRVDGQRLRFHLAAFDALTAHASKVREPAPDAPEVVPDAVVVPARAYDRHGVRLGRGAGYFDRTFAALPADTLLIGFSFALQVHDDLPRAPHDGAVHLVVTEDEPLRCRPFAALHVHAHAPATAGRARETHPWTPT